MVVPCFEFFSKVKFKLEFILSAPIILWSYTIQSLPRAKIDSRQKTATITALKTFCKAPEERRNEIIEYFFTKNENLICEKIL